MPGLLELGHYGVPGGLCPTQANQPRLLAAPACPALPAAPPAAAVSQGVWGVHAGRWVAGSLEGVWAGGGLRCQAASTCCSISGTCLHSAVANWSRACCALRCRPAAQRGFEATADVAVVGPSLKVLDADLAFEVRGPARSSKEARKQQQKYAAAKEARSLLGESCGTPQPAMHACVHALRVPPLSMPCCYPCHASLTNSLFRRSIFACLPPPCPRPTTAGLSLPQAQVLAELFGGRNALLDPPRPATIKQLIAFQAHWDRHPHLYDQICQVSSAGSVQTIACQHVKWSSTKIAVSAGAAAAATCTLEGVLPSLNSHCPLAALQVWNTAYQVVAQRQRGVGDFSFRAFVDGPVARVRRKPARAR